MMRVGVITFPGTVDHNEALRALKLAGLTGEIVRHTAESLSDFDAVVIAGGKSYGDYLRPGSLAQTTTVVANLKSFAAAGKPVLGVGGGFHVLLEAGLLPGALAKNHSDRFVRSDEKVIVTRVDSPWSRDFTKNEMIVLPVRTNYGAYYANDETTQMIEKNGQVVLRFERANSALGTSDIAGVSNEAGNVVGLLPQPEFAIEAGFGPDTDVRMRSGIDGLRFFSSLNAGVRSL